MDEKEITSDELIQLDDILAIHHRIKRVWVEAPLIELIERENALASYIIGCGERIHEYLNECGLPADAVRKTRDAAMKGMLVCIQAQHDAHFALWRDMMGDPESAKCDRSENNGKGESHGR